MTYRVYSISGAPRPWRVLLALVAKKLDFEVSVLEASKREQHSPAFVALNPRARVPVLDTGEYTVRESIAIIAHLERKHPEIPLFGVTAEESARVWEQVMESDHDLFTATAPLLRAVLVQGTNEVSAALREQAEAAHAELRRLAARLDGSAFVCGSAISAADCVAFPQVRLVARAIERYPDTLAKLGFPALEQAYPSLARWVGRIEAMPGYERTFPQHWKRARDSHAST